jgi:hypothetical protein
MKNSNNISPNTNNKILAEGITPVAFYPNAEDQKKQILRENKGKAGVYR